MSVRFLSISIPFIRVMWCSVCKPGTPRSAWLAYTTPHYSNKRNTDAAEPNTDSCFFNCLCRLHRHWHGRACTGTLCPITRRIVGHHWSHGISLPDLQFHLPVSQWLVGRPLGAQTGDGDRPAHPGSPLTDLPARDRPGPFCGLALHRGHCRSRYPALGACSHR